MSKSTLSITVPHHHPPTRTVEVPCRLPEAFEFKAAVNGKAIPTTAFLCDFATPATAHISATEVPSSYEEAPGEAVAVKVAADCILATAKQSLGLVLPGFSATTPPTLRAIALAYEAECAAHDAQCKALWALPRPLQNPGLVGTHPSERESYSGGAVGMLAQYVAWVFEQACDAQTQRAEAQAKGLR